LPYHPGGKEILLNNLGTDLTEAFFSSSIHEHGEKASRMLEHYRIGTINTNKITKNNSAAILDEELMKLIDVEKPIVTQVLNLSPPEIYPQWLHGFPTTLNLRLFESNFCEFFSRYSWWYIFPLWIPVILLSAFVSWYRDGTSIAALPVAIFCGLIFWSMLEYTLHRWVFHMVTASHFGNFFHFMAHGIHHLSPLDPDRLTFPPIFSVFCVAFVYKCIISFPIAIPAYNAFFSGGLLGFMMYDAMHFFFHHGTLCDNISYLKWMRTRHFKHHYVSADKNFGVSSPIWDIVFRTSV
jgi:sterol desaturase/sphingolipid hydroxylase (fatty acid hydroxylase superfamily)